MQVKVLVNLLKYLCTYLSVGYMIPTHVVLKRDCVGNIPSYLNFEGNFPRNIPTKLKIWQFCRIIHNPDRIPKIFIL